MTVVPGHVDLRLNKAYQTSNVIETLKRASDILEPHGLVMVLEPLNFRDHPGLFLTESPQQVEQAIELLKPDCLQFHGSEAGDFCEQWGLPYIKAIPMASVVDIEHYTRGFESAQGFLLDSNAAGRIGGTGATFDWSRIPSNFHRPLILAGGLNPMNVADAVTQVKPWAVDVSSGVEKSRGIKDEVLIEKFCKEVQRVNCESAAG